MKSEAIGVQRRVLEAWDAIRSGVQKMYQSADIRPASGYDVFRLDMGAGGDEIRFTVGPVIFNVPERATRQDANLFIAVKGSLEFERPKDDALPQEMRPYVLTKSFATSVGYFRYKNHILEHIYGAHYDLDEFRAGHPVFHSQIASQMDLLQYVNECFHQEWSAEDKVIDILRNVRTPTAQMDVFSVVAQICADHLIHSESGQDVRDAFSSMRASCDFFIGAAHRMNYLNNELARYCYRSTHWYAGAEI